MRICDECKDGSAKCLLIKGTVSSTPNFTGSDGTFEADLCRECFDRFRKMITIRPDPKDSGAGKY